MRALIVGCGYVGVALGARLVEQGHSVWGLRRSAQTDDALAKAGIVPLTADVTVPETLSALRPAYDWVVQCVSSTGGGTQEYERIYLRGTARLLAWLADAALAKFVYTSSTSVYGQTDGSVVDETSPTLPEAPTGQILVRAEEFVLQAARARAFPAVVLRAAGIYGPGRAYWLDRLRSGQAKIDGAGTRILNMVHRDDLAGAMIAALERGEPGRIYNVVDDEPVTQLGLFRWLSERLGRALPGHSQGGRALGKRGGSSKRVSNERLKNELGYRLKFPTFREGLEAVMKDPLSAS